MDTRVDFDEATELPDLTTLFDSVDTLNCIVPLTIATRVDPVDDGIELFDLTTVCGNLRKLNCGIP
ncbi:MAG: hypothetical protein VYC01_07010 [Nitrospinota bacterium]|nr:hypothetical protein [Nitrospinota bacterium]